MSSVTSSKTTSTGIPISISSFLQPTMLVATQTSRRSPILWIYGLLVCNECDHGLYRTSTWTSKRISIITAVWATTGDISVAAGTLNAPSQTLMPGGSDNVDTHMTTPVRDKGRLWGRTNASILQHTEEKFLRSPDQRQNVNPHPTDAQIWASVG
jgi:hypothetical protein